jgi:iron complex transport system substrate-binding protein
VLAAAAILLATAATAQDKVVTVGGAVTEIVFALDAGARIVATDSTSTYPPAAARLPQVGYQRALSAEGLLSTGARLLIATHEAGPPAALEQARKAGMRLVQVSPEHSPEAVAVRIRTVAEALGKPDAGQACVQRYEARWREVAAEVAALPDRPATLFLLAHGGGGPMAAGDGTAADAMLKLAGARNAVRGFHGYKPLTPEALAATAADVVLITREGLEALGGEAALWSRPGIASLPAARTRKLVVMDALYLLGFGPRLPEAVRELARALR